jgi:hypothetical protein
VKIFGIEDRKFAASIAYSACFLLICFGVFGRGDDSRASLFVGCFGLLTTTYMVFWRWRAASPHAPGKNQAATPDPSADEEALNQIPFGVRFNELFQSNRSHWRKLGGCVLLGAALSGLLAMRLLVEEGYRAFGWLTAALGVGLMAVSLLVGVLLVAMDAVRSRHEAGKPVHPIPRFLFGLGLLSLLLWIMAGAGCAGLCIYLADKW